MFNLKEHQDLRTGTKLSLNYQLGILLIWKPIKNTDPTRGEDDIIFDGYQYYRPKAVEDSFKDSPIICYKNVTKFITGLSEADGEYTVANLRATRGWRRGGIYSALDPCSNL